MNNGQGQVAFLNSDGRPLFLALGRYLESQGQLGHVMVLCADQERVAELDGGLWTFEPTSFVPQELKVMVNPTSTLFGFLSLKQKTHAQNSL